MKHETSNKPTDQLSHDVVTRKPIYNVAVWLSGNIVGLINEVNRRLAGLVLRWVTVRWYTVSVFNQSIRLTWFVC